MRGLRLGLGLSAGDDAYNPASTSPGAWYDPSDLSTLYQDTAAASPVTTVGQSVARVNDKSGNGLHITQATAAARPTYQVDANGKPYLLFDGVDDEMTVAATYAQPWDRISALQQIAWVSGDYLLSGGAVNGLLFQNGVTPALQLYDGAFGPSTSALALGTNGVVTERHSGAASRIAVNNGAYTTASAGTNATTFIALGGSTSASGNNAQMRFYGMVLKGAGGFTDAQTAELRTYLGSKCGLTL